jgi:hypothetical protein
MKASADITYQEIQSWIEKGETESIPPEIVKRVEQLDLARSLYGKYESRNFIIKTLCATYKELSKRHAYRILYDAINLFNLDHKIKKNAWLNILMNDLQNIKSYAWKTNDMETMRRCVKDQADLIELIYKDDDEFPEELYQRATILYTFKPEDIGMEKANRYELAKTIDSFNLKESDKERLKRDAMVEGHEGLFDEAEIIND